MSQRAIAILAVIGAIAVLVVIFLIIRTTGESEPPASQTIVITTPEEGETTVTTPVTTSTIGPTTVGPTTVPRQPVGTPSTGSLAFVDYGLAPFSCVPQQNDNSNNCFSGTNLHLAASTIGAASVIASISGPEPDRIVLLADNGLHAGNIPAGQTPGGDDWSTDVDSPITTGTYTIVFTATDINGNSITKSTTGNGSPITFQVITP